MFGYEDYRKMIADSLFENEIIDERLYEKCKKPSYITALPGDLRTNDVDVLRDRMDKIEEEINRREDIINDANYRIGVKTRDTERLGKRIEKSMGNMDKAVENINKESDKIVKDITALEDKLKKVDFEDNDLKKDIDDKIKKFKTNHNELFDDDLTGDNVSEYSQKVTDLSNASIDLNNVLQVAYDNGLINKSDLGKSDISKGITRIEKNIDKFVKEGQKINNDVQSVNDNQVDIDYIVNQSDSVIKEVENLVDEFVLTHNKYMENSKSPYRSSPPNPQMILEVGSKQGDLFTFLPPNYEVYIV